jgi:hypothetical protein
MVLYPRSRVLCRHSANPYAAVVLAFGFSCVPSFKAQRLVVLSRLHYSVVRAVLIVVVLIGE